MVFGGRGAVMNATPLARDEKRPEPSAEAWAEEEMVRRAREQGLSLTGPDGLLKQLPKLVLETALIQEMTEYLGHEKHELYISVRTVTSHLDRIRDKTGCRRRADLTRLARSAGLV
jgi:hypothetical protein